MDVRRILRWLLGLALVCAIASLFLPIWSLRYFYVGSSHIDLFSFGAQISGSESTIYSLFGPAGFRWLTALPSSVSFVLAVFVTTTLAMSIPLVVAVSMLGHWSSEAIRSRIRVPLLFAGVMSLVSPLVFYNLLPDAIERWGGYGRNFQFWESQGSVGFNYGPNVGWYLQFLAFFLIVFSIVAIYLSRPSPAIPVDLQKAPSPSMATQLETPVPSQEPMPEPSIGRPPRLFCGNCGKEIPLDSRLCPYCGTEIRR